MLLKFFVRLAGVWWIHPLVLFRMLLLHVLAFIASTTMRTVCRIWSLFLLEQSCQNASAVVTRSDLRRCLRLSQSTRTWIFSTKIMPHNCY
jgi:hypothetical protein